MSILSMSYEFSTGHAFHLFKLIFFMVTSFVLLSEEKISKKYKEKVKESQKNINRPKIDKKERSKSETTRFKNFYFGQKLVKRSSFRGHKFYVNFEHVL